MISSDNESYLILGPAEAKVEFKTHLESEALSGRFAGIETMDKMTDRQIAAKIREHMDIRKQAMDEMHHAEWLIERIIFFEGTPTVSKLNPIKIGKTVSEIINNDNSDELDAVRSYNEAIKLARAVDDQGTIDLLSKILKMEEGHVDWAEIQRAQIEQMGMENYLVNQTEGEAS
jgi:bacterioferritin